MSPLTIDKLTGRELNRRQILKGAGALSAAGALSVLLPIAALADEGGETGYQFLDVSDGKAALTGKSIFMNGAGKFGSGITGGGRYVVTDTATFSEVFDFGTWKAKKFVSFTNGGDVVAGFQGGTLTMDVSLRSSTGAKHAATVTVNCDGGAVSPNGGNGSGDVVTLVIKSGSLAGTFGPGSVAPFNVTIFSPHSD